MSLHTNTTPPTPAQQERVEQFARALAQILRRITRRALPTPTNPTPGDHNA